jgi:hypothetical protein
MNDPQWLHCLHYPNEIGFTIRKIWFENPERSIPCLVCAECKDKALTPSDVCAGEGSLPEKRTAKNKQVNMPAVMTVESNMIADATVIRGGTAQMDGNTETGFTAEVEKRKA